MKAKAYLSAFGGFLYGFLGYFVLLFLRLDKAFQLAALGGLLFGHLLFLFLIVYGKIIEKRYEKFEKEIASPIFYKTNGNSNLGSGKVKNGNIYFCEAGIICACLEEKPYTVDEIPVQDIDRISYTPTQLNLFTKDGRMFLFTVPKVEEIVDMLMRKGWILPG